MDTENLVRDAVECSLTLMDMAEMEDEDPEETISGEEK